MKWNIFARFSISLKKLFKWPKVSRNFKSSVPSHVYVILFIFILRIHVYVSVGEPCTLYRYIKIINIIFFKWIIVPKFIEIYLFRSVLCWLKLYARIFKKFRKSIINYLFHRGSTYSTALCSPNFVGMVTLLLKILGSWSPLVDVGL